MSLGVTSTWLEGFGPNRKGQMANIEYLYGYDHTANRYRRLFPHGTLEPITQVADDPAPEPLGVITAAGFRSNHWPAATPDTIQPVA